jgi:short-subunit dehydrogenase
MTKRLIISGATRGIGKSIAEIFAANGFDIAFCSRTEKDVLAFEAHLKSTFTCNCKGFVADVSVKSEVLHFGIMALDFLGGCDVLVNNAGVFIPGGIQEEEDGIFEKQMSMNISSSYHLSRVVLPQLIHGQRPHIFNMCSIASIRAYSNGGSYCISKFAMLGLTRVLREELKPNGVSVTAVMPGATLTESWGEPNLPSSRFMQTTDIAKAIWTAWEINEHTVIEDLIMRPIAGDI